MRVYSCFEIAIVAAGGLVLAACSQADHQGPRADTADLGVVSMALSSSDPDELDLATGPNREVYRLSHDGSVWRYQDAQAWVNTSRPTPQAGSFAGQHVAVDPRGRPWLAGTHAAGGASYAELWYQKADGSWQAVPVPSACSNISDFVIGAAMGDLFIICGAPGGTVYRWLHSAGDLAPHSTNPYDWAAYPGTVQRVAVGDDNQPYVLWDSGQVSRWDDDYNIWRSVTVSNDYEKCYEDPNEFAGYTNTANVGQALASDHVQGGASHRDFVLGACDSCNCDTNPEKVSACQACLANHQGPDMLCWPPHRAYPYIELNAPNCSPLPAPVLISFWAKLHVHLDPAKYEWFSLATLSTDPSPNWNPVQVLNYTDYGPLTGAGRGYVYLAHVPVSGQSEHQYLAAKTFPLDQWIRLDMFVDYRPFHNGKGVIKAWQDGKLVASAEVAVPASGTTLTRAHFGFYGSATLGAGNEVYNDSLRMQRLDSEAEAQLLVQSPLVINSCASACR